MNERVLNYLSLLSQALHSTSIPFCLGGSVAYELHTGDLQTHPSDIDILVPKQFSREGTGDLLTMFSSIGFNLVNLREAEFSNGEITIGCDFKSADALESYVWMSSYPVVSLDILVHKYREAVQSATERPDIFSKDKLEKYIDRLEELKIKISQ